MKRFALPLFCVILLGAGCFGWGAKKDDAPQEPVTSDLSQTSVLSSGDFGTAVTGTEGLVEEEKRWDVEHIYSKGVSFEPPAGYWVYLSADEYSYWLVTGEAPPPGGEDPKAFAFEDRVATIQSMKWDESVFPTWERYEQSMAQMFCLEGTSAEDMVGCQDTPERVITGTTVGNLLYKKFVLQAVRRMDQAPRGSRTFVTVRLGEDNIHGVIFSIEKEEGLGPALELAKSMRSVAGL